MGVYPLGSDEQHEQHEHHEHRGLTARLVQARSGTSSLHVDMLACCHIDCLRLLATTGHSSMFSLILIVLLRIQ